MKKLTYWELALIDELLDHHIDYHEEQSTSDLVEKKYKDMHKSFMISTMKTKRKIVSLMDKFETQKK